MSAIIDETEIKTETVRVFHPYWKRNVRTTVKRNFDHQIKSQGYNKTTECELFLRPIKAEVLDRLAETDTWDPIDPFSFEFCARIGDFDFSTKIFYDGFNGNKQEFEMLTLPKFLNAKIIVEKISGTPNVCDANDTFSVIICLETFFPPEYEISSSLPELGCTNGFLSGNDLFGSEYIETNCPDLDTC